MSSVAQEIELSSLTASAAEKPLIAGASLPFVRSVKVRVWVRVGEAEVTVGELLDMKQGAVLPLDRLVDQPLDVMVDGHVVARGTLVAVGDHFGVRMTEPPATATPLVK
jgi:flagellar motor switch protein FliN